MTRAQRLTLLACVLGSSMVFLDGTLVNVALPAIRHDLGGGLATQQWIVDAYLLTLGSLLLVGGSLGDVLGRDRVFAAGVAGFGAASILSAAAPDAAFLIAVRALQGVAGALLVPSTLAMIIDRFPVDRRAAAIGAWTAWTGIATAGGPLAGGLLVQLGSWRYIFLVNVPLALATLHLIRRDPARSSGSGGRVDWVGGALCALGLAGPVFALIEEPRYGWSNPRVWPVLVVGCVLLAGFVLWERRSRAPMLPLGLFASRNFAVGNVATLALYAALNTVTFFVVVFLQQVAGYSPLGAGLALLPLSIVTLLLAERFGRLADRRGPRLFMGVGPLVVGAGLLLLLRIGTHAGYASDVLPGMLVFAFGLAMTVAPLTAAVLGGVDSERSGIASGVNNAVARVAGLVAIAAVGAVVAGHFSTGLDQRLGRGSTSHGALAALSAARERPFVLDATAFPSQLRPAARAAIAGASLDSYRLAIEIAAALAFLSGLVSLGGIAGGGRAVAAADCPGGALYGASSDAARAPSVPALPG